MYRQAHQQLTRLRQPAMQSLEQGREQTNDMPAQGTVDFDGQLDLLDALRRLPTRQREVVVLTELCDLDQATAAEILGISVSALKTHKARGLRTLQSKMTDRLTPTGGTDTAGGTDT